MAESTTTIHEPAVPVQQTLPLAKVRGEVMSEAPLDLYIPPEALEVFLDAFEGPLDLLLYLIKRKKLDILDLNLTEITAQYIEYIELMQDMKLELAADYLVMAAFLTEVKSRLLLPVRASDEADEEDPRAALIRRLQEYERFKVAAQELDTLPRDERDYYQAAAEAHELAQPMKIEPQVSMAELFVAFTDVMKRASAFEHHQVQREALSTRERMSLILEKVSRQHFTPFDQLFEIEEGRAGVVVTFLAILELVKESMLDLVQNAAFQPIHVRAAGGVDSAED
ncbi:segregation and condensation protein A [Corallincola spongiicola]|uniref:Segregation and condensation protein A n=1 Tax=Corallincola spongiicola TaxID=2520508 RepID=A0ABY1WUU3_9GAMM|nr:segregation/condensation protein A [Corallincola spongiicola]TAA48499.1 segregation/condensation protein A [Corallincola spongiicola]